MGLFNHPVNDKTKTPRTRYLEARKLAGSGYYQDALDMLDEVQGSDPTHADSWFLKGFVLYQMNRYDEALQVLDRALSLNPRLHEALVYKGLVVSSYGRYRDALALYDQALSIEENFLTAWYARGLALALLEQYDDAIRSYERVLDADPKHIDALSGIRSAMKKRDTKKEQKRPGTVRVTTPITQVTPINPEFFERDDSPTQTEYQNQDTKEPAPEVYPAVNPDARTRHDPTGPVQSRIVPFTGEKSPFSHLHRSITRTCQPLRKLSPQTFAACEDMILRTRAMLDADPLDTESWHILGDLLMKTGKYPQATEAYERALEMDAEQPEIWSSLGDARRKLGFFEDALFSYQQALLLNPDLAATWILHAKTLTILGRHEDALVSCDHALAIDEHYIDAWLYKGFLFRKISRPGDALTAYERVLEVNPVHDFATRERESLISGE